MTAIDWSVFDQFPENTCECACGAVFRSHTKTVRNPENTGFLIASRNPCPGCGKTEGHLCAVRSDPETFVIGSKR